MRKYKVSIDLELCVGDGLCCEVAPDTFDRDEQGYIVVTEPHGDPPQHILSAARNCQMYAITLFDADTGELVWPEN